MIGFGIKWSICSEIWPFYVLPSVPFRLPITAAGTARRSGRTADIPRSVPHNATANRRCCPKMLSGRACPDGRPRRVACVAVFSSPSCLCFCSLFRFPFACKIIKTSHSPPPPPPRLPPNRPPPPVSSSGDARAVPAGLPCISSCHH